MYTRWCISDNLLRKSIVISWCLNRLTLYDERLSIVSRQRVKQVPRSASKIWIRLLDRDRVSPRSRTTTGIPVKRSSHLSVWDALPRYRFANDSQTNTCKSREIIFPRRDWYSHELGAFYLLHKSLFLNFYLRVRISRALSAKLLTCDFNPRKKVSSCSRSIWLTGSRRDSSLFSELSLPS
jgi:hypothetical protein